MHYVEKISLETGLQITQPFIRESFTPADADKYITIDIEKENSNLSFSCFQEVVNFIHPILEQEGISIIQIGGSNQRPLNLAQNIQGKTNISQTPPKQKSPIEFITQSPKLLLLGRSSYNPKLTFLGICLFL